MIRGILGAALVVLGAGCCAAGCTGSLFQSKAVPQTTYQLSAPPRTAAGAAASPPAAVAADLAVLKPRVRAGLDTDRIAVLYPDRRLEYFADAHWSGTLDDVVQDLAVQAFRDGAGLRNVGVDASAFGSGYWLEIEVADFQAEYAAAGGPPVIDVRLLARVGGAADRRILGSVTAAVRRPAADNRLTAIVDAYAHAVDDALARIVEATSRTLGAASEHR